MTNYHEVDRPPVLAPAEIEKLLSMSLIANLATINDDGDIHMVPMWFLSSRGYLHSNLSQCTQAPKS